MFPVLVAFSFFLPWLATVYSLHLGFFVSVALCFMHFNSYRFMQV